MNYLNNVLAKREANLRGADDALVLNGQGLVAEASATNVFVLQDNRLETPPVSDGALEGLTRRTILEIGRELGFEVQERSLGRFDLYAADAVFLTGSRAGLIGVGSLDGSPISQSGRARVSEIEALFETRQLELSVPRRLRRKILVWQVRRPRIGAQLSAQEGRGRERRYRSPFLRFLDDPVVLRSRSSSEF